MLAAWREYRSTLRGLSTRGRAFLAAGVTAVVSAFILGQTSLTRVGVLLAAVPLLAAAFLARGRYRLALVRTATPTRVEIGQPSTVTLTISDEGRLQRSTLLLEDQIPYSLGARPRFVFEQRGRGAPQQVSYQVRSDVRGRYELGPLSVRISDPFGMVEVGRSFRTTTTLMVTPRVVALPDNTVSGSWSGSGDNRPRSFATGSAEDVTVREYRRGDDLRRVHWRSSARVGELMVRREEQPWQSRATLLLDNRALAHRGIGPSASLETAVSAAASIAVHLGHRGFTVRMITATGQGDHELWHARDAELNTGPLLERLAVLQASPQVALDTSWLSDSGHGGLLVAVLGAITPADLPALRRIRQHAQVAHALTLDVGRWSAPAADVDPATALVPLGWQTTSMGPGESLPAAWQALGRTRHLAGTR